MSFQKPLKIPGRRKVLTKNMILDAQSNSKSASECARWLGVSFNTYKKWAQYYKVYDNVKNQSSPEGMLYKHTLVKLDEFNSKTQKIRVTDSTGKVWWITPSQVSASFL
jgi:folylpolyglutamate synthase/dihydropteroate synthase